MAQKIIGYREMTWTCPNCGTKNPGTARTCQSCGAAMSDSTNFESQTSAKVITDEKVIETAKKGPDIVCAFCGNRNPAGTQECTRCGAPLSEGHERQTGAQHVYETPSADAKPIVCPACGTENPAGSLKCKSCGSELSTGTSDTAAARPVESTPQSAAGNGGTTAANASKKRAGCGKGCVILLIILAAFAVIAYLTNGLFGSFGSQSSGGSIMPLVDESYSDYDDDYDSVAVPYTAPTQQTYANTTVDAVVIEQSWKTSVRIVGDVPSTQSGWKDDMPSNATNASCQDKLYQTYDYEVSGAKEVCGDTYTVDLGNGYEALAQDCVYEVYKPYCQWTVYTQGNVGTRTASGNGPDVESPYVEPEYSTSGNVYAEYYVALRDENGVEYDFSPSNYYDYRTYTVGSEYVLELNSAGRVVSMEEK